ncbi:hypothetical protein Y032_0122g1107 [Ancylostoma ceylanicum]|uniref:Uncharacterized protein n=1 Tax=Ancylostoma ceylanicum TaxID=53326 RepID=A0A016T9E1_9BILA|nr:hypothetical protein Y032_0122g1107 [Ancylostoma ceylanicum]
MEVSRTTHSYRGSDRTTWPCGERYSRFWAGVQETSSVEAALRQLCEISGRMEAGASVEDGHCHGHVLDHTYKYMNQNLIQSR